MNQESYVSKTREAGKRARQLRKAGFKVSVSSLGAQTIDPEGPGCRIVTVSMVNIYNPDGQTIPAPDFTPTRI